MRSLPRWTQTGRSLLPPSSFLFPPSPFLALPFLALLAAILACSRQNRPIPTPGPGEPTWIPTVAPLPDGPAALDPPTTRLPDADSSRWRELSAPTPTPDPTRTPRPTRASVEEYVVQPGDALGLIAQRYGLTVDDLLQANDLLDPDILSVGQVLLIPVASVEEEDNEEIPTGPGFKIIPDSELVYSPASIGFSVGAFLEGKGGYLAGYTEEVEGDLFSGAELVQFVAERYSVNPRILLAVLEFQSGWVTRASPRDSTLTYPIGRAEVGREGLYKQLSWAANQLNAGYYWWRAGVVSTWTFPDGDLVEIDGGINAGTAGVQRFFATLYNRTEWERIVTDRGFIATYQSLFGYPFMYAVEPLVPGALTQPALSLPFEPGKDWVFTGGPHGGWDSGSGWAALDFAPPAEVEGCTSSDEWVAAAAPGLIVRTGHGAVVQDLDGDGYEQSGWVLFYMHVENRGRVTVGSRLQIGDRIGHPSCEGGFANGTHVHIARKFNGEWIPADGPIPLVLDGWVSSGVGVEYDGYLTKDNVSIEACDCRADANTITK